MATILDLFKQQKKDLYGKVGSAIIESRGLINPPRGAALLTSSPNAIADLIGNQIGGVLKGSANRPSDTIFRSKIPLAKPISLFKTPQQLRNAIDPNKKNYFVKKSPSPSSFIANLQQGASNPVGALTSIAIKGVTKGGLKELKDKLKNKDQNEYTNITTFSENKTIHNLDLNGKKAGGLFQGKSVGIKSTVEKGGWQSAANDIQKKESFANENELKEAIKKYRDVNQVWVTFKKYGKEKIVPFIGAITGISEDLTPEWSNFRYIGSPFKIYRYLGVERTLKFNLKLYYITSEEKSAMIKKVNYLKSLTFPTDELSQITYGSDTKKQTSQYAFAPNLVYLSIGDMYKNVFGFVENISFNVEDNVVWPNADVNGNNEGRPAIMKTFGLKYDNHLYPSVIDVSVSMKIIETHETETAKGITKYKYDFDGITYDEKEYNDKGWMKTPFKINE